MKPQRLHTANSVRQGKVARLPSEIRNLVNIMLNDASKILAALNTFRALQEIQRRPADELLNDPSNTFLHLARITNRQTAERTRRERLEARNALTEAHFINQLVADPEKLARVLAAI